MTQAEKIAVILEMIEKIELALVTNDRQKQVEYARELGELRRAVK